MYVLRKSGGLKFRVQLQYLCGIRTQESNSWICLVFFPPGIGKWSTGTLVSWQLRPGLMVNLGPQIYIAIYTRREIWRSSANHPPTANSERWIGIGVSQLYLAVPDTCMSRLRGFAVDSVGSSWYIISIAHVVAAHATYTKKKSQNYYASWFIIYMASWSTERKKKRKKKSRYNYLVPVWTVVSVS